MKRNIFIIFILLLTMSACSGDFLNQTPSDQTTKDEAITTLQDVKVATNGLYELMASTSYYNAALFLYGDVKGDDMQPTYWSSGRISYKYYTFEHSTSIPNSGGIWGRSYYIIRNAYNILDAIDKGQMNGADETINEYKGEALACIALSYFNLVCTYGYPYAKDNGNSLGVPIVDHAVGYDENPDRSTVAQCYDFIISKLTEAIPLLTSEKSDGRINSYAARALLSRVYLYCNKNNEAFETADKLIKDIEGNGIYYLSSYNNYIAQFNYSNKFASEALFQISNTAVSNPGRDGLSYLLHWWGYAAVVLTEDFANFMRQDPNDIRSKLIASYYNSGDGHNYDVLLKYPGEKGYDIPSFDNNYTVIRLSEVYLIAAESGLKAGSKYKNQALAYLNRIVQRANPNNEVTAEKFTLDRILDERRRELVGEGHRYFDMLRNGKTIYRKGGKHLSGIQEEINWNYFKCVLPIAKEQFTFNPDMKQNPGYTKE